MRAARQIHRHTALHGRARSRDRATHRAVRALDERRRPRKAQPADLRRIELAVGESLHVRRVMRQPQLICTRPLRLEHAVRPRHPLRQHPLAQHRVLRDRKAMRSGEGDAVAGGGEEEQGWCPVRGPVSGVRCRVSGYALAFSTPYTCTLRQRVCSAPGTLPSALTAASPPSSRPCTPPHPFITNTGFSITLDVLDRIAGDGDDVGELADGEGAELLVPAEQFGGAERAGGDRLHRREPAPLHHQVNS